MPNSYAPDPVAIAVTSSPRRRSLSSFACQTGATLGFALTDDMVGTLGPDGRGKLPAGISRVDVCLLRAGAATFATLPSRLALTVVVEGRCDVESAEGHDRLGAFVILLDDSGKGGTSFINRSPDFEAYQVQLRA
jgi:hypothetical protein